MNKLTLMKEKLLSAALLDRIFTPRKGQKASETQRTPISTRTPQNDDPQRVVHIDEIKEQKKAMLSAPLLLMIGSLTGCSKKDAIAYAKGLAEKYATSLETVWVRVERDKARDRFVFEIHEGGEGYSILEKLLERIEYSPTGEVWVELAGGKFVIIEETHNQLHSLIAPSVNEVLVPTSNQNREQSEKIRTIPIVALCGNKKMTPLFVNHTRLLNVGLIGLGVGLAVFTFSATLYVLNQSAWMDKGLLIRSQVSASIDQMNDSPILHLSQVKKEAQSSRGYIKKLTKEKGQWNWELGR